MLPLAGLLGCALLAGDAPLTGEIVLRGFRVRGLDEHGAPAWILNGEEATATGDEVALRGARVLLFRPDGEIHLFSPRCRFNRLKKTGSSDESLRLIGLNPQGRQRYTMDGVGFDLDLVGRRITIRHQVKVLIFERPTTKLDK